MSALLSLNGAFVRRAWLSVRSSRYISSSVPLFSYPIHEVHPMPALSPTMEAGSIASWLVKEGGAFSAGQALCEVQTDKATVTFDAQDDGYLAKILVGDEEITVGRPIMITVEEEEDIGAFSNYTVTASFAHVPAPTPAPAAAAPATPVAQVHKGPLRLSPAARHLVESKNLNVHYVSPTSKGGRMSKGDVILAIKSGAAFAETKTAPAAAATPAVVNGAMTASPIDSCEPVNFRYIDVPNNAMRKIIAKRLTESKQSVPHFYMSMECDIDNLLQLRKALKKELDINISVNDIVIKSAALALRDVPEANGKWTGGDQKLSNSVDISVAVATPNGLITPIITNAEKRGMVNLNNCMKDLAGRARLGKLKPEEYQGGTFTISNLGMFGIANFQAVINPPQACILAVGGSVPRVMPPRDGEMKPRVVNTLTVELSADRRVVDESTAAAYLQAFNHYLSNPKSAML